MGKIKHLIFLFVFLNSCTQLYYLNNPKIQELKKFDNGDPVKIFKKSGEIVFDKYITFYSDTLKFENNTISINEIDRIEKLELTDGQIIGNVISGVLCFMLLIFVLAVASN